MEVAIRQRLINDTEVSGIVSKVVNDIVYKHVYVPVAPHKTQAPYVVFQRIGTTRHPGMGSDSKMVELRIQFTCVHKTYEEVKKLAKAVHDSINRWRENGVDDGKFNVLGSYQVSERDIGTELIKSTTGVQMDYRIIFEEV